MTIPTRTCVTLPKNPCFRKTAKQQAVTSTSIHKYYEELLDKTENEMPDYIRELVEALPSFLATKRMVDKLPILEQKIGEQVAVITTKIYVFGLPPTLAWTRGASSKQLSFFISVCG